MNRSKALYIFDNIENVEFSENEKAVAIHIVMNMTTLNGTTKDSMVTVIKHLWNQAYEFTEKGD